MNIQADIVLAIISYSICSGTLVLINKMTLHHLPYPSLVTCIQLTAALAFIYGAKATGYLPVDPIKWEWVMPYMYYIVAFSLGVYCNMKSLSMSNVETVIVFKALSPCFVSVLDVMFLGRECPSTRSWAAIGLIVAGAYGYASYDEKFQAQGPSAYVWPSLYLVIISFEMAYGKSLLKQVKMQTQSGPVLYTNLLGLPPMLALAALGGEFGELHQVRQGTTPLLSTVSVFLLVLGCMAGTGIGYSSWWCRGKVSATSFTIIGVMNKCLTVLLNLLVWDQHAPPGGIASLNLCLIGGSLYRQAPMRKTKVGQAVASQADDVWGTELSKDEMDALVDSEAAAEGLFDKRAS
jgi:GDP-mannose transporter